MSCAALTGARHFSCTAMTTSGGAYGSVHLGHSVAPAPSLNQAAHKRFPQLQSTRAIRACEHDHARVITPTHSRTSSARTRKHTRSNSSQGGLRTNVRDNAKIQQPPLAAVQQMHHIILHAQAQLDRTAPRA